MADIFFIVIRTYILNLSDAIKQFFLIYGLVSHFDPVRLEKKFTMIRVVLPSQ